MPTASKTPTAESANNETGEFDLSREGGEGWRPKAGDVLIGEITNIGARWSDWSNSFYPVLTIRQDDGNAVSFHAFHTVAFRRVMALKPLEGERIGIKYHGEMENADKKTKSAVYTIRVNREPGSGHDPYAGLKPPAGRQAKAADAAAKDHATDEDIPF